MEACFNDISTLPIDAKSASELLGKYASVIKGVYARGYNKIRYDKELSSIYLYDEVSIRDLCKKHPREIEYQLILSTFTQPGIDEQNEEFVKKFVNTSFELPTDSKGRIANCFAYAYASNTICVGFESDSVWQQCMHSMNVTCDENCVQLQWPCISNVNHLSSSAFLNWFEQNTPLILTESKINPNDKTIHITDDHGKDVLLALSARIKNNKYVEEIYSAPYKPYHNKFIYEINPSGEVTIVLTQTPQHLSLTLKTTGRNLRETKAIADIIERQYKK